ncbi:MAG: CsgG/HfaB family protein [Anaerovibrio sp.]
MLRKRCFTALLAGVLLVLWQLPAVCFAGLNDYPTLAIIPFGKKASISPELTLHDVTIANEIVYDELVNSGYFNVVERERLDAVCDEMSFDMSGLVDQGSAARVGKMLGAQYILIGSLNGLSTRRSDAEIVGIGNKNAQVYAHISMRVVEVETGSVVLTGRGNGRATNTLTHAPLRIIHIGNIGFDQEQVYDAIEKATMDAVNGKRGLITALEGRRKK